MILKKNLFIKMLKEKCFLFDLDGTLVDSDKIYLQVWKKLLSKYNINIDMKFFKNFIRGKSDYSFMKFINQDVTDEEIKNIQKEKDELFIQEINGKNILYDGVMEFLETTKNIKKAIVTSSNNKSASHILKIHGLDSYFDLIISSEDVKNHKPHPEPYILAATLLKVSNSNCFVFEDSDSGIISAKKFNPKHILVHSQGKNSKKITYFNDYKNLNIDEILSINNDDKYKNMSDIFKNFPPHQIDKSDDNIKAGFICDIERIYLNYRDKSKESFIIKINNNDNELSKVAKKLNMYEKEEIFYSKISQYIKGINVPKFYGLIHLDDRIGIILEDLNKYNGKFDINLNNNISLLLDVITEISKLHKIYYFENDGEIPENMKDLTTVENIEYYNQLIENRYDKFIKKNSFLLSEKEKKILTIAKENFILNCNHLSKFPLSLCHGDLKSPNIFYKDEKVPYFLDWQYIHLGKGISDVAFLLVESIEFDEEVLKTTLNYYYLQTYKFWGISYENIIKDFKISLSIFPLFVTVWFNSEDSDKLIDKSFPIRFMKNLLSYYKYFYN